MVTRHLSEDQLLTGVVAVMHQFGSDLLCSTDQQGMHFLSGFSVASDELSTQVQRQGCKIATSLSCSIALTGEKCSLPIAVIRCTGAGIRALWTYLQSTLGVRLQLYKPAVRRSDIQLVSCRDCSLPHACTACDFISS